MGMNLIPSCRDKFDSIVPPRRWVTWPWHHGGRAAGLGDGCYGSVPRPPVLHGWPPPLWLPDRSVFSICEVFSWCSPVNRRAYNCIVGISSLYATRLHVEVRFWRKPVDNIFFPGNFCWQFLETKSMDYIGPQQIQVFIHDYLWIISDFWLTSQYINLNN